MRNHGNHGNLGNWDPRPRPSPTYLCSLKYLGSYYYFDIPLTFEFIPQSGSLTDPSQGFQDGLRLSAGESQRLDALPALQLGRQRQARCLGRVLEWLGCSGGLDTFSFPSKDKKAMALLDLRRVVVKRY